MDHNSIIELNEIRHVFEQMKAFGEDLNDNEIDELLKDADVNGDGYINYEEFLRMFTIKKK